MAQSTVQALEYEEMAAEDRPPNGEYLKFLKSRRRCAPCSGAEGVDRSEGVVSAGASVFVSRFVILQAIGASAIIGLWIAGLADKPFRSAAAPMCYIILSVGALGMLCVLLQRWPDVKWIATHVVRIGLLGTVVGLIIAFSHAATGSASNPDDVKPMIAAVVSGMYVSLYATLLGIGTNLWLKINLRLLGNEHG